MQALSKTCSQVRTTPAFVIMKISTTSSMRADGVYSIVCALICEFARSLHKYSRAGRYGLGSQSSSEFVGL